MFIDILFATLLIVAFIKGFTKGFVVAIFSFVAIIVGLLAALKLSAAFAIFLQKSTNIANYWLPFISFALIMIGVIFLAKLLAKFVEKTIEFAMMGWLNKLAGVALFASVYLIILSVVLFYLNKLSIIKPETIASSKSYVLIEPIAPKIIDFIGDSHHYLIDSTK